MTVPARVTAWFRDLPIRLKLRFLFIVTTVIALLLAGIGIVAADSFMFYRYLERDLGTFVTIIGDNSTGVLAFDDPAAANEILSALRARSHVEVGCLWRADGTSLAKWTRPGFKGVCPPAQISGEDGQVRLNGGVLVASRRISLAGRSLGALVLQYDLGEIPERIVLYGVTVLVALLLACIATILLSARLRALIGQPILELADTARSVSHSRDYSIRAAKNSSDELGTLADALNQMMEGIQARDNVLQTALRDQRDALARLARANADLKRSNADLARSNSDLERFAFVASHDLQEPLRMITAYSELLVAEYFAADAARPNEFVRYIVGGTQRMRELLADLLTYTEIAGSEVDPAEPVNLNEVIKNVRQTLSIAIAETGAEIVAEELPTVEAHEGRMGSLFQNLIANGIKYRGPLPPRIHISVEEQDGWLTFAVRDNGIGIQPEYFQKIFVAFQRLHGKEVPGTGIGLAICHRVVERYGGRIWVDSEAGSGSVFRFTLPRSIARPSAQAMHRESGA